MRTPAVAGLVSALFLAARVDAAPAAPPPLPPPAARAIDFVREIQPLFQKHCYSCHGPEKQKGDLRLDVKAVALQGGASGPAILPRKAADSPLLHFIAGIPEDMRMPQKGDLLPAAQIALIRDWIDQGASWPDGLDPADFTEKKQHWAFRPPARPPIPAAGASAWPANPIDHFILRGMETASLTPSPAASRRQLIRRLSFSVLGLPPSPAEVEAFAADPRPEAYPELVDRLLASPHYGERWARHWLDVVRFAESTGFETNLERKNAWPYRDYVIRSLNENKPYRQFILEQIAGDALGVPEATGFIVAGPWDAVKSPDINLTLQQRQDELHDMVSTTGSAFLGLTVGCARCHNHKFDPISQKDYYAMQAVFAGVQHGDRPLLPPDHAARSAQAETLRKQAAQIDHQLSLFEPLADPSVQINAFIPPNPKRNEEKFPPIEARFIRFTIHETAGNTEPCIDELEVFASDEPTRNAALAQTGAKATASGTYPNSPLHQLAHIHDGKTGNSRSWISNEPGRGWVQIEFPQPIRVNRVVWGRDREEVYKDRLPISYAIEAGLTPDALRRVAGLPPLRSSVQPKINVERFNPILAKRVRFTIHATTGGEPCLDELEVYSAETAPRNVALASLGTKAAASGTYPNSDIHRLEHLHDGRLGNGRSWISNEPGKGWVELEFPSVIPINKIIWGRDREERFGDRLATDYVIEAQDDAGVWRRVAGANDRQPYGPNDPKKKRALSPLANLSSAEKGEAEGLLAAKKQLEDQIQTLTRFPAVYAGRFEEPPPTFLLYRGDPMLKREPVPPGVIEGLGPAPAASPSASSLPEQQRRLALAEWLAHPQNPLTARVMVNRIWQYHFGRGIVDTPSDFGVNGARPTHPELLDWLAVEFMDSGWDLKAMHRLILLSKTYQQTSRPNPAALAIDADSRLLWRFPPRRLEAEPLRDAILAVSGNLDLKMGGPGFDLFEPNSNYVKVYKPKQTFGPEEWRRMIYQSKPRMRLDDTFGAFDCPDAGQIAPKRTTSTTPLQALNLLNSPFMQQQAGILASRLQKERGVQIESQIQRAFQLAFHRDPSEAETRSARALISQHGLAPFCRALFNANEFVYLF